MPALSLTKVQAMKIASTFYWAWGGLRRRVRLAVATLAGHGVFDIKHFRMLTNPNVPIWLAATWIGFDISMTVFRAVLAAKTSATTGTMGFRLLQAQGS